MEPWVCWMCKESLNTYYISLPDCEHRFHAWCIMRWTEENNSDHTCKCPMEFCDNHYDSIYIMKPTGELAYGFSPVRNILCCICLEVLTSPIVIMRCCSQGFCFNCSRQALCSVQKCPMDRSGACLGSLFVWNDANAVFVKDVNLSHSGAFHIVEDTLTADTLCRLCRSVDDFEPLSACVLCYDFFHRECALPQTIDGFLFAICPGCFLYAS